VSPVPTEPLPTAIALLIMGVLLGVAVLASRTSGRLGIPFVLLFLLVGVLAGSEGIGRIPFEDYGLAFRAGTVALVLILFDGGLNTAMSSVRRVLAPAGLLATVGVAGTAAVTALGARALGFGWPESLLLGAIVSSTDAAAVFSILRSAGIRIRPRLQDLLEVESGVNDPMAVILTLAVTQALVTGELDGWGIVSGTVIQLTVGVASGFAIGRVGRWLLGKVRLAATGLYPVLTLAIAFFAFGAPTLLSGSGFVAVYVAGVVLADGPLPYLAGLRRVHDAMAWFSQVAMFLLLGLLAFPSRLASVAGPGLALGLFLAFVARPLVVALFLAPFRMPAREILYVAWVGLRGAVPIMLATFPVFAGVTGAKHVFDLVFFVVVVSALVQGTTIRWLARRLGLEVGSPPPPRAMLEILSTQRLSGEVVSFYIEPASAVAGSKIADLPVPEGSTVMLIVRGRELVAARGRTVLEPGDHVYVFTSSDEKPFVQLLFGRQEED
jgi:cell volume regulation protein A